jgi:S-DNA-T family DNA segregation ATPase FtsK/SpoIIIE
MLAFRATGFVVTLATSCGLATLHFAAAGLPETAGGVLGQLVGNGLANALSFLGATLMLLALWLAGVSLFIGMSWLAVMDYIGKGVLWLVERGVNAIHQAREAVISRRAKKGSQGGRAEGEKAHG